MEPRPLHRRPGTTPNEAPGETSKEPEGASLKSRLRLPARVIGHLGLQLRHRVGVDVPKPFPCFVLKVTDLCNARCTTCNVSLLRRKSATGIPEEVALQVVREMARHGALFAGFVGGEPLLYEPIMRVLAESHRLGMQTSLNTHGAFITSEVATALSRAGLSYASISLDYPDALNNEDVRRGLKFEDVTDGICRLRVHSPRTTLAIGMTITRQNIDRMVEMCRFVASLGIRYLKFQPFHSHLDQVPPLVVADSVVTAPRAHMAMSAEDLPQLAEALTDVRAVSGKLGLLTNARMLQTELAPAVTATRTLPCAAGDAVLFVDPHGRVGGCPETRSRGSLASSSLDELMAAEPEVFRFAETCPLLPTCFDTTYGELSHLLNRRNLGRALDVFDRFVFYAGATR